MLTDDDFEVDEDGEIDYSICNADIDDKKEEYIDYLCDDIDDPVQYLIDNYGEEWLTDLLKDNSNLIDMEAIIDECISEDGIAHFLAKYDGEELELENGLYAYRTN